MKKKQPITVGLVIASVGLMALAFAPVLRDGAAVWWFIGLVGLMTAFSIEQRAARTTARSVTLPGIAFVAAAAAGIALVGVVAPASAQAAELEVPGAAAGPRRVVQLASELQEADRDRSENLIRAAQRLRYEPRSGLTPNWAAATAYDHRGAEVVSVPLTGTDVPEMTKISFLTAGGRTSVTEMASAMQSSTEVHFAMWEDGTLTKNVKLDEGTPEVQPSSIGTNGLDWNRLNNCLNSIGISWAVIAILGVACGAACATALLCAPCLAAAAGFTTGTIAKCVSIAWS